MTTPTPMAITVFKGVTFGNKRFSSEDLKRVAYLIKKAMVNFEEFYLSITFFLPDSQQSTNSFSIFEDVDFFRTTKISALEIRCREYGGETHLSINIGHDAYSFFSLEGEKNWVSSTESAIHELMDNISPAHPDEKKIIAMLPLLLVISIPAFLFLILFTVEMFYHWATGHLLLGTLSGFWLGAYIVILLCVAIISAGILFVKFIGLWPHIDIDTGPEHLKREKIKWRRIGKAILLLLTIALPTILAVVI